MTDDPVEVLALSLYEDENGNDPPWTAEQRITYLIDTIPHLRALEAAGYRIVAREPTKEMVKIVSAKYAHHTGQMCEGFRQLWDAAPTYADKR